MFESVRKNFVRDTMTICGLLLLVGVLLLYALYYSYNLNKADEKIQDFLDVASVTILQDGTYLTGVDGLRPEAYSKDPDVAIGLIQEDQIIYLDNELSNYDDEVHTTENAVLYAAKNKVQYGSIPGYKMRYGKKAVPGGQMVVLVDCTEAARDNNFILILLLITSVLAIVFIYTVSHLMARRAVKPLEKNAENQNRFLADVSHELKTPLTVIIADMDIAMSNGDATIEEQKKWLESAKEEALRMTNLVTDMLTLSRSDADQASTYHFALHNISDLVDDCVMTAESLAFEKGVTLESDIDEDLSVIMDDEKIKQVLMILLDNALKYAGEKGRVKVTLRGSEKLVSCTVFNTGDPIPEAKSRDIFERFFRIDDSRTKNDSNGKGGFGLGLSIAKNIVDKHNGKIVLDYSDETGTCFSFSLPGPASRHSRKDSAS